jgi:hypothetical protein
MVGLILWITWVADCVVLGEVTGVKAANEHMKSRFDGDDLGELTEYTGCKIERNKNYARFTQPVLLQSYQGKKMRFNVKGQRVHPHKLGRS